MQQIRGIGHLKLQKNKKTKMLRQIYSHKNDVNSYSSGKCLKMQIGYLDIHCNAERGGLGVLSIVGVCGSEGCSGDWRFPREGQHCLSKNSLASWDGCKEQRDHKLVTESRYMLSQGVDFLGSLACSREQFVDVTLRPDRVR